MLFCGPEAGGVQQRGPGARSPSQGLSRAPQSCSGAPLAAPLSHGASGALGGGKAGRRKVREGLRGRAQSTSSLTKGRGRRPKAVPAVPFQLRVVFLRRSARTTSAWTPACAPQGDIACAKPEDGKRARRCRGPSCHVSVKIPRHSQVWNLRLNIDEIKVLKRSFEESKAKVEKARRLRL